MFGNPMYYNNYPNGTFSNQNISQSFLNRLTNHHKINWSNLLNNTQKTLNVINQAIPVYYQIKPIYNNAKTMFRMVNALKDDDIKNESNSITKEKNTNQEGPVFFT